MRRLLLSSFVGMALWLAAAAGIAQEYDGNWNRVFLNFSVSVESWGTDCGARPRSYSSKAVKPTEIIQNKGHLFFSTGGLRTDRCNSPNPLLVTLATSQSGHMWTRTCETPAGSGRYEKIDYTFSGSGNRLTYVAESSFRWSLNEDLCVVSWVERRTWERAGGAGSGEKSGDESDSPIVKVHDDSFAKESDTNKSDDVVRPECENPGKVRKLVMAPKKARVSPAETLCFQLRGIDSNGCRFPVAATWSASQNGMDQSHLMNAKGCFVAGNNAAESEGVFQVAASYRNITVQGTVDVKYPDIGDLALARIDLSEETEEANADTPPESEKGIAPIQVNASAASISLAPGVVSDSAGDASWLLGLLIGATVVFLTIATALVVVLLRKPGSKTTPFAESSAESYVEPLAESSMESSSQDRINVSADKTEVHAKMLCPSCGALYPSDARFCPVDATELVEKVLQQASLRGSFPPPRGMICPTCKRGYELGARFCPHDSTGLVEYEKWRKATR